MQCVEDGVFTVSTSALEQEMCAKIPRLEAILRTEAEKARGKVQDDLATFITSTPEERYLHLLKNRPALFNRVPQHQIASYIGVKPESLSRIRRRILAK